MRGKIQFSDDELTGYLDGELDKKSASLIEKELVNCTALADRLAALEVDKAQLKSAFSSLLDEQHNFIHQEKPQSRQPMFHFRNLVYVGSLLAAIIMGIFVGIFNTPARNEDKSWMQYVAAYQRLYVTQTLSAVAVDEQTQMAELVRVGKALGRNIELTDIEQGEELQYKRAQILGFEGRAIVQMTFLTPIGAPVALCIRRTDDHETQDIQSQTMEGMAMASWRAGEYEFMLIGGRDTGLIERTAKIFYKIM